MKPGTSASCRFKDIETRVDRRMQNSHFRHLMNPRWLAASLVVAVTAMADPKLRSISLDECVRLALEKNLDLRIIRYEPRIQALELGASFTDYYDPKFTARAGQTFNESPGQNIPGQPAFAPAKTWNENYSSDLAGNLPSGMHYDILGTLNRNSGNSPYSTYTPGSTVSITQPLLKNFWIDSPRLTMQLNKNVLQNNEQDVVNQALTSLTAIANAYYDLAAARENVEVERKALELAEQQYNENKIKVQVGTLATLDEKQAESQAATVRADLITAEATFSNAENTLKRLITDDFASLSDTLLDPAEKISANPVLVDKISSWERGLKQRPDVIQARLLLEKQKITIRFNRNQLFPQLDLTGSYGVAGRATTFSDSLGQLGDRDYPNFGIGAVFSYPLSNRSARNRYKEAKLLSEQYLLQYKLLEQQVMAAIANNIDTINADFKRVEATRAATKYAELAYEGEKRKLENGKSTSFIVLQLQRDLTTARSTEIRALADYNKALFALYQSEGSTLERLRIRFSVR